MEIQRRNLRAFRYTKKKYLVPRADNTKAERQAQDAAASDNALASMFRVCAADVSSAPVDQVLGLVLPRLPLQEDAGENSTCAQFFIDLAVQGHPAIQAHAASIRTALSNMLSEDKLDDAAVAEPDVDAAARLELGQDLLVVGDDL